MVAKTTMTMGDRMHKARRDAGVSVVAMATRQGVSEKTINNWERSRTHPKRAQLEAWAGLTGFPFEWLLYGDAWLNDDGSPRWGCTADSPASEHLLAAA
jgi:transcriptional regulator with XRE-family HTH domain